MDYIVFIYLCQLLHNTHYLLNLSIILSHVNQVTYFGLSVKSITL